MILDEVVHGTRMVHHSPLVKAPLGHTTALRKQSPGVVEVDQRNHALDNLLGEVDLLFLEMRDGRRVQVVDKCFLDGCVQTLTLG